MGLKLPAFAIAVTFATAARAQDHNWPICEHNGHEIAASRQVTASSAVIDGKDETGYNMSSTYYDRGLAYDDQEQNELAIRDYNDAIRLNPKDARHFLNRAGAYATTAGQSGSKSFR